MIILNFCEELKSRRLNDCNLGRLIYHMQNI
nr:MAG TPA: hypothetical protein [Caudoviricetes sp.]